MLKKKDRIILKKKDRVVLKRINILFKNQFCFIISPWALKKTWLFFKFWAINNKFYFNKKYLKHQISELIKKKIMKWLKVWCFHFKLIGFGYKIKIFFRKIRIYVGYCHHIELILPKQIICKKEKKRKYHFILISLDLNLLKFYITIIKQLRPLNCYKFLGIINSDKMKPEKVQIKPGKQQYRK